jgi:transcription initiation factor TFIID subunit TAF12
VHALYSVQQQQQQQPQQQQQQQQTNNNNNNNKPPNNETVVEGTGGLLPSGLIPSSFLNSLIPLTFWY